MRSRLVMVSTFLVLLFVTEAERAIAQATSEELVFKGRITEEEYEKIQHKLVKEEMKKDIL